MGCGRMKWIARIRGDGEMGEIVLEKGELQEAEVTLPAAYA